MPIATRNSRCSSAARPAAQALEAGPSALLSEESGIWDQQRLELVHERTDQQNKGKKRLHVNTLTMLQGWLIQVFGLTFVNPEAPIDVAPEDNPTNEPEPDIIVLRKRSVPLCIESPPRGCGPSRGSAQILSRQLRSGCKSSALREGRDSRIIGPPISPRGGFYVHRNPDSGKYRFG